MTIADRRWLSGKLATQALYGAEVTVLATSGSWSKVAVSDQPTPLDRRGYPGWLPTIQLTTHRPASTATIAVVRSGAAWLRRTAGGTRDMEVSYDTRLPVVRVTASDVEVVKLDGTRRWIDRDNVAIHTAGQTWPAMGNRLIAEAKRFLGLQYLWGGTSGFAYDCSGLNYSVYHALGITIPRDAAPQASAGTAVPESALAPGDLVFFRDDSGKIVHVAMYVGLVNGVRSVIQAPRTGSPVQVTPLTWWPAERHAGARRYV